MNSKHKSAKVERVGWRLGGKGGRKEWRTFRASLSRSEYEETGSRKKEGERKRMKKVKWWCAYFISLAQSMRIEGRRNGVVGRRKRMKKVMWWCGKDLVRKRKKGDGKRDGDVHVFATLCEGGGEECEKPKGQGKRKKRRDRWNVYVFRLPNHKQRNSLPAQKEGVKRGEV